VKGTLVDEDRLFRFIMQRVVEVFYCVCENDSLYYFSVVYFTVSLSTRCPMFGEFKNYELKEFGRER